MNLTFDLTIMLVNNPNPNPPEKSIQMNFIGPWGKNIQYVKQDPYTTFNMFHQMGQGADPLGFINSAPCRQSGTKPISLVTIPQNCTSK